MKTYTNIFVKTSILFVSVLILATNLGAETIPGTEITSAAQPNLVSKFDIRICVNSTKQIELSIQQANPELSAVIFAITKPDGCDDIKLKDIPASDHDTEHWVRENSNSPNGEVVIQNIKACAGQKIIIPITWNNLSIPSLSDRKIICPVITD